MIPEYVRFVLPSLPRDLWDRFTLVPTLMLAVGIAAEALGVYILLVAGTDRVPVGWRFRRYTPRMRTELLLWWTVLLFGVSTYSLWYAPQ
ncbi:MAG: hypothetical protein L3K09_04835 [Thermoplasmata archaeon]|nr:hypothetical protein [Thermoplasmata archaeon]